MCVFLRFWVYWETIGVFFRIFPKVDKVDLARSSQNRGLRFEIQMYVLAEIGVILFELLEGFSFINL